MDSSDFSIPASPVAGTPTTPARPVEASYPTQAHPVALPGAPAGRASDQGAGEDPFGAQRRSRVQSLRKRIGSILAAIGAAIAKFWAAIKGLVLLLPKVKLLGTMGTALVSVAAYSLFFGWTFAAGFVLLLFVHEMGHVVQLRREGVKEASAPMFIPFLGAAIFSKSLGDNALAEARVGLAGPVLGTLGSAVCLAVAEAHEQQPAAGARLHRLLPEPDQLDPGRAVRRGSRDGGDGARDVVRRSRCAGDPAVRHRQPIPAHLPVPRLRGNPPALARTQDPLAGAGRLLPHYAAPAHARRRRVRRVDRAAGAGHGRLARALRRRAQLFSSEL